MKDVIEPTRGSYNRHSRLHVLKEEVTLRNYDKSVVDAFYMNDKHREVLMGQLESLLAPPSPPKTEIAASEAAEGAGDTLSVTVTSEGAAAQAETS